MRKTLYQLSPLYELIENAQDLMVNGYEPMVLRCKQDNEIRLLNAFILSFLKTFEQPTTLLAVTQQFQQIIEGSKQEIEASLKPFLMSMLKQGIIEPIKHEQTPKLQMPNDEGLELGIYTLEKRLACTPPIDIYRATDAAGQSVLLKRILFPPHFPEKYRPQPRRKFAHEFKILKILRGVEGICSLIKFEEKNDFAVIEFFEGFSLRSRIKDTMPVMTLSEKIIVFAQILKTMAAIHNRKVLHGDLHYSNILLNKMNEVRIIDFDLALLITSKNKNNERQGGIRDFIPPERIDDSAFEVSQRPPDFRSEVFQIGVIGYFIFFGDYPFKGTNWKELAKNIREAEPNWSNAEVSMPVISFLKKALSKKPTERFESAEAMLATWKIQ
jgi:eukaryotic-like serine/threonine-protein kinase